MPALARAFSVDGIGPVSIVTGSTPARAKVWNRARGVRPSSLAFSSLMMSTAEAPSEICERVAGGDLAVGLEGRLQVGERLGGGAGADALVLGDELVALDDVAGLLVEALLGDPDDLVVEAALVGGPLGALLALGAEGVEVLAGDAPLVGDHLGRDALGHEARVGVAGEDLVAERDRAGRHRRAHRGGGHHLDAGGDGDVVGAGDHALGGEVGRLLATSRTGGRRWWRAPTRGSRRRARRCGRC